MYKNYFEFKLSKSVLYLASTQNERLETVRI
jgi:hypothetical protein